MTSTYPFQNRSHNKFFIEKPNKPCKGSTQDCSNYIFFPNPCFYSFKYLSPVCMSCKNITPISSYYSLANKSIRYFIIKFVQ